MELTPCLAVAAKFGTDDRDELLRRVDELVESGVAPAAAQNIAATDMLAEIERERSDMIGAIYAQHGDLFGRNVPPMRQTPVRRAVAGNFTDPADWTEKLFMSGRNTAAPERALERWVDDLWRGGRPKVKDAVLAERLPHDALGMGPVPFGAHQPLVLPDHVAAHMRVRHRGDGLTPRDIARIPDGLRHPRAIVFDGDGKAFVYLPATSPDGRPMAVGLAKGISKLGDAEIKVTRLATLFSVDDSLVKLVASMKAGSSVWMPSEEVARFRGLLAGLADPSAEAPSASSVAMRLPTTRAPKLGDGAQQSGRLISIWSDEALRKFRAGDKHWAKATEMVIVPESVRAMRKINFSARPQADLDPDMPVPLYVARPVVNAGDILAWAKSQGIQNLLPADELHLTIAHSSNPIEPSAIGPRPAQVVVAGGERAVKALGDAGAVLSLQSGQLDDEWAAWRQAGASWDFSSHEPDVSLTYGDPGVDLASVEPYRGAVVLGEPRAERLEQDIADDAFDLMAIIDDAPATDSTAFKRWFGKSKVVNADGTPLVVYHGTAADFTAFDMGRSKDSGAWFSPVPGMANVYAGSGPGAQVMPLYVSLRKPYEAKLGEDRASALLAAREGGHDGVIVRDEGGNISTLAAFSPGQIKSAIGNVGFFDENNPDIRYSTRRTTESPAFRRWFGRSVIVDANGRPRVMYHGTARDIAAFRPKQAGAIFVTDSAGFADGFADASEQWMVKNDPVVTSPEAKADLIRRVDKVLRSEYGPRSSAYKAIAKELANGRIEGEALDIYNAMVLDMLPTRGNIMPLWVRAESPFDYRSAKHVDELQVYMRSEGNPLSADRLGRLRQGDWTEVEADDVQDAIRALGHDAFYSVEMGQRNLAVYDPTQLKSAIGNRGTFDPEDPDIRYAARQGRYDLRDFNIGHQAIEAIQDRYNRWKQAIDDVRAQGGRITEANDFYRAEERYWGIVGSQIEDFRAEIERFVEDVAADKLMLDDVALYAYAQHAPERNAWIAAQRASMPDGGSGMLTQDALDLLDEARQAGLEPVLQKHAATLRRWIQGTRDLLFNRGLIDQDEYDAWTNMFQDYVPLRGLGGAPEQRGIGQGFNIRGDEGKRAMGRKSQAKQIIEQIVQDRVRALIRTGKNEVLRSFLAFVLDNPSPNLWDVNAVQTKPVSIIDANGNRVIDERQEIIADDRTVTVKDGGKEIHILVNDERLRQQLQNLNADQVGKVVGAFLFVNRILSRLYTSLSPVFTVVNGTRDVLAAGPGMIDEIGFMGAARLYANLPASLVESYRAEFGRFSRDYSDYRATGGKTGFFDFKTLDKQTADLQDMLANADRMAVDPRKVGPKLMDLIESLNGGIENATRLAAFKAARQSGMSLAESSRVAKNITVNFNRKGTMTPALSAYFLFFNPAVQGTARIMQALSSPKVLATLGAGMLGVFALAMRNAGMGDDDDGVAWWDKIPDEVKERNLVIVLPPGATGGEPVKGSKIGRYLKIPMPYGYNFFAVLANQTADVWRNMQDPKRGRGKVDAMGKAFTAFMGAWVPVQELGRSFETPQSAVLAAVPDALNPLAQIAINTSSFGRPLYPNDRASRYLPDATKYFPAQAGSLFQRASAAMNSATGGGAYRSGLLDFTPATLETIARGYGGGPVSFGLDLLNALYLRQTIARDTPRHEALPFVKQLYGVIDAETDRMTGYQRLEQAAKLVEPLRAATRAGNTPEVRALMAENGPMLMLGGMIDGTRQQLSELRKQELALVTSPKTDAEKFVELEKMALRRRQVLQQFNAAFDRALTAQAEADKRSGRQ